MNTASGVAGAAGDVLVGGGFEDCDQRGIRSGGAVSSRHEPSRHPTLPNPTPPHPTLPHFTAPLTSLTPPHPASPRSWSEQLVSAMLMMLGSFIWVYVIATGVSIVTTMK